MKCGKAAKMYGVVAEIVSASGGTGIERWCYSKRLAVWQGVVRGSHPARDTVKTVECRMSDGTIKQLSKDWKLLVYFNRSRGDLYNLRDLYFGKANPL